MQALKIENQHGQQSQNFLHILTETCKVHHSKPVKRNQKNLAREFTPANWRRSPSNDQEVKFWIKATPSH